MVESKKRKRKSKLDRIKEKAAEFKLNWEPIRDAIDRSDKIADLGITIGLGYFGYRVNEHWTGALTALLGYRLARANNLASGVAGISTLSALGLLQATKPVWSDPAKVQDLTTILDALPMPPIWDLFRWLGAA